MKLPIHTALHIAASVSTIASAKGVYNYFAAETNGDLLLSATGAGGIGLAIYLGWEVAFGHSGKIKRLAAAVIAVTAATLSSYTIYQNTALPTITQARDAATAQDTRAQQQLDAASATLKQQLDDLRIQINDLRTLNSTDTATIKTLTESDKKEDQRQADKLRKAIESRNTEISKLSQRTDSYTNRMITPAAAPTTPTTVVDEPIILSWAMLARASSYEIMTALFLLFGNWYRTEHRDQENTQIQQLQTVAADTNAIILKLEGVIAHADHRAADIATNMTDWATKAHATITALETIVSNSPQQQAALTDLHRKIDQQLTAAATLIRSLDASTVTATDVIAQAGECTSNLQTITAQADECTSNLQKVAGRATAYIAQAQMYDVHSDVRTPSCTSTRTSTPTPRESSKDSQTLSDDSALELLKSQKIPPDELGKITTTILMEATGFGRRKAEKLRDKAVDAGILVAEPAGKGSTFRYADQNTKPTTTHSDNVVTLKRSA
jgi:hypothetical protein